MLTVDGFSAHPECIACRMSGATVMASVQALVVHGYMYMVVSDLVVPGHAHSYEYGRGRLRLRVGATSSLLLN